MNRRRLPRPVTLVALAVGLTLSLTSCASMPTTGAVHPGGEEAPGPGDIGQIAFGPAAGANPEQIVSGFLLAAQAGPTTAVPFAVAREYLASGAQFLWHPYSQVMVLDGSPEVVEAHAEGRRATVRVTGTVVASLDERGVYTEQAVPAPIEATFELTELAGQWRITALDDVLLIPAQVFAATFHATRLYFPTIDHAHWVIEQRWFPGQTWRTNAVQELLAGPPPHLIGAVEHTVPAGTILTINAIAEDEDGVTRVPLSEHVEAASGEARALFSEQVRATLSSGAPSPRVVLEDQFGPLVLAEDVQLPTDARTHGSAQLVR
ncbi:MAG: hypothetical protein FWG11_09080, partial [Promicromonosporaceae bacterium]|nr:hypothetical protein [Promicromonosporaceae bacterium]